MRFIWTAVLLIIWFVVNLLLAMQALGFQVQMESLGPMATMDHWEILVRVMVVIVLSEMVLPGQVAVRVVLALVVQVVVQAGLIKITRKIRERQEQQERLEMAAAAAAVVQVETNVIQITQEMAVLVARLLATMVALQALKEMRAILEEMAPVVAVVPLV